MAWGPSRPPWAGRPGRGGTAPPPPRRAVEGEEEGEKGRNSESLRNSGFLFMWKIKGKNKRISFWQSTESPNRFRRDS